MKTTTPAIDAAVAGDSRIVIALEIDLDPADGGTQRYVAHTTDITFPSSGGDVYQALGFSIDTIQNDSDLQVGEVRVTVNDIDRFFTSQILVTDREFRDRRMRIKKFFLDHLDNAANFILLFQGPTDSLEMSEKAVSLLARSSIVGLQRRGPRGSLQVSCGWEFGDPETCTVDTTSAANLRTGTATTGGSFTSFADTGRIGDGAQYWRTGTITFTSGLNNGRSRIIQNFDTLTGAFTFDAEFRKEIQIGDTYEVRRGCDRQLATCTNVYNNTAFFGGFPFIPREIQKAS